MKGAESGCPWMTHNESKLWQAQVATAPNWGSQEPLFRSVPAEHTWPHIKIPQPGQHSWIHIQGQWHTLSESASGSAGLFPWGLLKGLEKEAHNLCLWLPAATGAPPLQQEPEEAQDWPALTTPTPWDHHIALRWQWTGRENNGNTDSHDGDPLQNQFNSIYTSLYPPPFPHSSGIGLAAAVETLLIDNHESKLTDVVLSPKWQAVSAGHHMCLPEQHPTAKPTELLVLLPGQVLLNGGLNTFGGSSVALFSRSTVSRCILMQKYKLQCTIIQRQGSLLELGHVWAPTAHPSAQPPPVRAAILPAQPLLPASLLFTETATPWAQGQMCLKDRLWELQSPIQHWLIWCEAHVTRGDRLLSLWLPYKANPQLSAASNKEERDFLSIFLWLSLKWNLFLLTQCSCTYCFQASPCSWLSVGQARAPGKFSGLKNWILNIAVSFPGLFSHAILFKRLQPLLPRLAD